MPIPQAVIPGIVEQGLETAGGVGTGGNMGWVIPAALGLGTVLDFFGRKSQADKQNEFTREQVEADRGFDEWALLQQLLPQLSRDQALDPVRNATIADIGSEFFPGIDPGVFAELKASGAREGVIPPPSSGISVGEYLRSIGPDPAYEGTLPVMQGMRRPDGLPRPPAPPPPAARPVSGVQSAQQPGAGAGRPRIQLPRG